MTSNPTPQRRRRSEGAAPEVVPEAKFSSYYGRQIVKPAPWTIEIPIYIFAGGLAAGSSMLAAGAQLTGRPTMRRVGRLAAAGGLAVSLTALVSDLGRPSRFLNMLRTVKLTSPMSVGTWLLSLYAAPASLAALDEIARMLPTSRAASVRQLLAMAGTIGGVAAGITAPPVAAYTAVLLSNTSTPSWHEAYRQLPFVFVASAAAASGGLAMALVPTREAGPARRLAVTGAAVELLAERVMEESMGITAEPLQTGSGGKWMRAAKAFTIAGGIGAMVSRRRRWLSVLSGVSLLAGSFCTRMAVFQGGLASAKDPKYTVVPQRERVERGEAVRYEGD